MNFESIVGQSFSEVTKDNRGITFVSTTGQKYRMYHPQDCCESVYIEDICGDLSDLIDSPILMAEESSNDDDGPLGKYDDCYQWTFYKLATVKGYVTIRWYGTSNGYYSVDVRFDKEEECRGDV